MYTDYWPHVVVRATLARWEDCVVDTLLEIGLLILAEEDHSGTWTAQGLVAALWTRERQQKHICKGFASLT